MNKKNIENIYPLSPTQQGILFHTIYALESGVYVVQSCYTVSKIFNIPALKQAWQQVIDHHPILRTSFYWQQHKEPFQVVHKNSQLSWQQYDWQAFSVSEQQERLDAFLQADRQQGFDISQAPLMRLSLIQISLETFHLIWSSHHLILDGWSGALVLQQVFQAYEALAHEQVASLPYCRPYADYISWLQQQDLSQAKAFWRKVLQGFNAPTHLRVESSSNQATGCDEQRLKLSPATTAALQSLVRQHKLTLNTLVQGVWAILLSRYSGEEDVVFGATSAGRPPALVGSDAMVGLFINTLPVRVQVSGDDLLIPWLQKLQTQQIEVQQYEYTPLVEVQGWSEIPRDLPLFESILVFENYPVDDSLKERAMEMQIHNMQSVESTNYPITVSASVGRELSLAILSDRSRFDTDTIRRMLGHLQILLEGIVANPCQSPSSIPLLTAAEIHQQLVEWNATHAQYSQDKCIHQLFEIQAEKTPDAVAVVFEDQKLTYRELNQRSNQLAHYLRKLGVSPEVSVCICIDRSLEMIVGLLGILKAGGAYVPLDPVYPQEWLKFIQQDVRSPILLTQEKLVTKLSEYQKTIVCLDTDWSKISEEIVENLVTGVQTNNLAYVIYTSGSTGKPKGVMIQHQSLVNFTETAKVIYEISASDRILQFASISFDTAAEEIYPCLICGATLVIRTDEILGSVSTFMQKCREWELTVLDLPTAYWHMIASELTNASFTSSKFLRLVIIGGEQVLPEKVAIWRKYVGIHPQLINTYGPTEATVVTTFCNLSPTEIHNQEVSIGYPISNVQVYILDQYLQTVPVGILGEIYIGGAGLARGYLNRPDLTHEKFIPNPFLTSTRLYKTGDLAHYRLDGAIEFIGRIDDQVKVRGFRIELGEIEAVLAKHQDVQQTVVIAKQDSLVAYVVPCSHTPTLTQLRDFLKQQLPYYMVPNTFVFLENLPLTPNGKIDRKALLVSKTAKLEQERCFRTPRTPLEKELVGIWSEILKVQQVGIDDNFFDLGGHSLLIVQMFARLRASFQVDLQLQDLFESPTVATFAERLGTAHQSLFSVNIAYPTFELKDEATLDPTINCDDKEIDKTTDVACILLTGVTGFLGAFLLDELLQQTQADIYCLVRAANAEQGKQRIQHSLESYLIWNEYYSSRIIPVVGDLSQPLLGLSQAQFTVLAKKLDVIYHNGAWVHHASPYSTLKAANVLGTQEVLRLACQIKIKPVHFISTDSVFSAHTGTGVKVVHEHSNLDDYPIPEGGYTQSKWVAEKLVTIARDRGLPVCIYRPGRISGHSKTGVFNPNDFFYRLLIGCTQLGSVPKREFFDGLAPVDYVSKVVVHLSKQQESLGKNFHVLNQKHLELKILFNVVRSFGYPLTQVSDEQWQVELFKIADNFPNHPLYPLIPLFARKKDSETALKTENSNFVALYFDCSNTQKGLQYTSIVCPPTDEDLLTTYFSYLIRNKFIFALKASEITVI